LQGSLAPSLAGVASRYSVGQLRLRVVDQSRTNPPTIMPPYYRTDRLARVAPASKLAGNPADFGYYVQVTPTARRAMMRRSCRIAVAATTALTLWLGGQGALAQKSGGILKMPDFRQSGLDVDGRPAKARRRRNPRGSIRRAKPSWSPRRARSGVGSQLTPRWRRQS
jgi:hypothetical protein